MRMGLGLHLGLRLPPPLGQRANFDDALCLEDDITPLLLENDVDPLQLEEDL